MSPPHTDSLLRALEFRACGESLEDMLDVRNCTWSAHAGAHTHLLQTSTPFPAERPAPSGHPLTHPHSPLDAPQRHGPLSPTSFSLSSKGCLSFFLPVSTPLVFCPSLCLSFYHLPFFPGEDSLHLLTCCPFAPQDPAARPSRSWAPRPGMAGSRRPTTK